MKNTLTAVCTMAALLVAAYSQTGSHQKDVQALKDNEIQWNKDFVTKNLDTLVSHYSDDAVLMSTGMMSCSGKEEIRKMLADMVADPAVSLKFQTVRVEVAKSGDMGFTQGTYQITMTDPASKRIIHDHGSYVTTYRKQADGSWKAVADIASSEVSPGSQDSTGSMEKK